LKTLKCTVIGANGFIGSYLCRELVRKGFSVYAFDRCFDNILLDDLEINFYLGDLSSDNGLLEGILRDTDVLFHLAYTTIPSTSDRNISYDISSNLIAAVNLFMMCVKHNVKKVIFPSSGGAVYGVQPENVAVKEDYTTQPISSYGVTKLAIEKYLYIFKRAYGLDYVVLRLANPYGPKYTGFSQGVIPAFIKNILAGKPLEIWGNGEAVRDYIYIDDVIAAFLKAIHYQGEERIFNIGSGTGMSVNQLLELLESCAGKEFVIDKQPARTCDVPFIVLDISKAEKHLDWRPAVSIEEGVLLTFNHMKKVLQT